MGGRRGPDTLRTIAYQKRSFLVHTYCLCCIQTVNTRAWNGPRLRLAIDALGQTESAAPPGELPRSTTFPPFPAHGQGRSNLAYCRGPALATTTTCPERPSVWPPVLA